MVNMLFNKILGENEKGLSFILRNQRNFLANPMDNIQRNRMNQFKEMINIKNGQRT